MDESDLRLVQGYKKTVKALYFLGEYIERFDEEKTLEMLKRVQKMIDEKNLKSLTKEQEKVIYGVPEEVPSTIIYDEKRGGRFIWKRLPKDKQQEISQKDIELMTDIENEFTNKTGEFNYDGVRYIQKEMTKRGKKFTLDDIESVTDIETDYLELIGAIKGD